MLSRREIKNLLSRYSGATGVARPVLQLALDYAIWVLLLAGIALPTSFALKLPLALLLAFWCARLFVIGHDACHGSYTSNSRLNKVLGRAAFLPTLTAFSLWEVGHNVAHHGYNNLKTHDFVWTPLSASEYAALPAWRKLLERAYRSGWLPGLYYLVEIWWKKLFFPNKQQMPSRRPAFLRDNLMVVAFAVAWVGTLVAAGAMTGQSIPGLVGLGFVLPYLVWCSIMGFVVYVQHTHPDVRWYDDKSKWSDDRAFLTGTVHVKLPQWLSTGLHHILEHTAHHVDMSVPLYQLQAAQGALETALPDKVVAQDFSWRWYFQTARECQLYDYAEQRWLRFPA
ncbi:Delta(12)-fatty-acid desaturase [compost metagenome]